MKTTRCLFAVIIFFVFKAIYAQDGTLDSSFDNDGILSPNYGSLQSENLFLRVPPDGRIVTVETVSAHGSNPQYYLRRYDYRGFQDASFGIGGIVTSDFAEVTARVNGIELMPDGKIIVGGIFSGPVSGPFFARYDSDGFLDLSFGSGGVMLIGDDFSQSFALQSDGKLLVVHAFFADTAKLSRYGANGILDTGFGVGGSIDLASQGEITLQADGMILLASGNTITRYLNNGTIDTAFGLVGTATIDMDISSIKASSDGMILSVGYSQAASTYRLMRLLPTGAIDASFGTGGIVSLGQVSRELEFQADGKIIVAGSFPVEDGPNQLALSRFLTNGDLDMSFGSGGKVSTSLGASVRVAPSEVETTADGKIVVGGILCEAFLSCNPRSFVARYNTPSLSASDFAINKDTFTAYPNPVGQIVNVDFDLAQSEVLSMDLFDINGRKVSSLLDKGSFQTGHSSQKLDLPESLSQGIYFLNISNGSKTATIKISK